jgi:hypothetical protein
MSTINRLKKHYDLLSVVERINLFLEAHERDDLAEANQLEWSCRHEDAMDYNIRLLALANVVSLLVVRMLAAQVLLVKVFDDRAQCTGEADARRALNQRLASCMEHQAAIWRGFTIWCRRVGHDPMRVLRLGPLGFDDADPAYFILRQQIEFIENWTRDAEDDQDPFPDPEKVDTWYCMFAKTFGL